VAQLIYKTAPTLMVADPEATVQMLLTKPQLSVADLLPALLHYVRELDRQRAVLSGGGALSEGEVDLAVDFEGRPVNFATKYLQETLERCGLGFERELVPIEIGSVVSRVMPEPVLLHTLLWLHAKYDAKDAEEEDMMLILQHLCDMRAGGHLEGYALDVEHVLRQCRRCVRSAYSHAQLSLIVLCMSYYLRSGCACR
jgi:hypothetical protein